MKANTAPVADGAGRQSDELRTGVILRAWWPLAASTVLMNIEGALIVACVARLAHAEVNLAALGGIVMAVTFAIESPILMLHTASAALCLDRASYLVVYRFSRTAISVLTLLHAAVALTPLYYLVASGVIAAPQEIVQPGRLGLIITMPYLAAVAYRRFKQGVLIRHGRSHLIIRGTLFRLLVDGCVLAIGLSIRTVPGVVVGAVAMSIGVIVEAVYAGHVSRPVIKGELAATQETKPLLTSAYLIRFYAPLALNSIAFLVIRLVGSAAMSRMPDPVASLAVWSPVFGMVWMLSVGGAALVQVVVSLMDRPNALARMQRFTAVLAVLATVPGLLVAATPIGSLWFGTFTGLEPPLLALARSGMWVGVLYPPVMVLNGLYQGVLAHAHQTRPIADAVIISSLVSLAVNAAGVVWGGAPGLQVGVAAIVAGGLVQTIWLWRPSRPLMRERLLWERAAFHGARDGTARVAKDASGTTTVAAAVPVSE